MRVVRRLLDLRLVLAATAIVMAAGIYVTNLPNSEAVVIAGPSVCSYYQNATFRRVVGARGTGCCGQVINWGVTTPYVRCEQLNCLDVICPF